MRALIACINLSLHSFQRRSAITKIKQDKLNVKFEIRLPQWSKAKKNHKMWIFCFRRDTIIKLVDCCLLLVTPATADASLCFQPSLELSSQPTKNAWFKENTACRYQAIVSSRVREKCGDWSESALAYLHAKNLLVGSNEKNENENKFILELMRFLKVRYEEMRYDMIRYKMILHTVELFKRLAKPGVNRELITMHGYFFAH